MPYRDVERRRRRRRERYQERKQERLSEYGMIRQQHREDYGTEKNPQVQTERRKTLVEAHLRGEHNNPNTPQSVTDWCPFCQQELIDLQMRSMGLDLFSNEPQPTPDELATATTEQFNERMQVNLEQLRREARERASEVEQAREQAWLKRLRETYNIDEQAEYEQYDYE